MFSCSIRVLPSHKKDFCGRAKLLEKEWDITIQIILYLQKPTKPTTYPKEISDGAGKILGMFPQIKHGGKEFFAAVERLYWRDTGLLFAVTAKGQSDT